MANLQIRNIPAAEAISMNDKKSWMGTIKVALEKKRGNSGLEGKTNPTKHELKLWCKKS